MVSARVVHVVLLTRQTLQTPPPGPVAAQTGQGRAETWYGSLRSGARKSLAAVSSRNSLGLVQFIRRQALNSHIKTVKRTCFDIKIPTRREERHRSPHGAGSRRSGTKSTWASPMTIDLHGNPTKREVPSPMLFWCLLVISTLHMIIYTE